MSILRGLIHQLLANSEEMFDYIRDAYSKHGQKLFDDDRFEAMWKVFEKTIGHARIDSVTCIVDGLDECIEESLEPLWIKFRSLMVSGNPTPIQESIPYFKLAITSRNYPVSFEYRLREFPRLRLGFGMKLSIEEDIAKYVDSRMDELPCSIKRNSTLQILRDNVRRRLVEQSAGTYLWVSFGMTSLRKEACPELEAALENFPPGLDGMY